jgi:hypothetical protein
MNPVFHSVRKYAKTFVIASMCSLLPPLGSHIRVTTKNCTEHCGLSFLLMYLPKHLEHAFCLQKNVIRIGSEARQAEPMVLILSSLLAQESSEK